MRPTAFGGNRLGVVALWCLPALTFLIPVACGLAAFGARNPVLGAVLVATGVAAALATRPRLASSVSPSRIDAVELDAALGFQPRRQQPHNGADQARFARARFPDNAENAAAFDCQIDAAQNGGRAAICVGRQLEIGDGQQGLSHFCHPAASVDR